MYITAAYGTVKSVQSQVTSIFIQNKVTTFFSKLKFYIAKKKKKKKSKKKFVYSKIKIRYMLYNDMIHDGLTLTSDNTLMVKCCIEICASFLQNPQKTVGSMIRSKHYISIYISIYLFMYLFIYYYIYLLLIYLLYINYLL